MPSTFGILRTGAAHHRANVPIRPTAELTGEVPGNVAVICLMMASIRILCTRAAQKRAEIRILHPAMDAVERTILVTLEQSMLAPPVRMLCARARQQRPRVVVFHSAILAVFTHCFTPWL